MTSLLDERIAQSQTMGWK